MSERQRQRECAIMRERGRAKQQEHKRERAREREIVGKERLWTRDEDCKRLHRGNFSILGLSTNLTFTSCICMAGRVL